MELTNFNIITVLIFTILIVLIWFLLYKFYFNQIKFNKSYKLLSTNKYFYIKYIFLFLSVAVLLFWVFWVKYWEKTIKNKVSWVDITFVLDVSKSMNVADIKDSKYAYTRLDIVKDRISNFVINHKEDRFGLIIFAWDAISTIPLTIDHDLFLTILKWVDYRNLTKQWSDFEKALQLWINRFSQENNRSKLLVFISDWWDEDDKINKNNIKNIISNVPGVHYAVFWIWTKSWWRIIKWIDVFWKNIYQKYKWDYVISKINERNLKAISSAVKGEYSHISKVSDLNILNKIISTLEKKSLLKDVNWWKWDFWRKLSMISFIFFLLFLILYVLEEKILSYNLQLWEKK